MIDFEIMSKKQANKFVNGTMQFPDCNKCKHYNRDATCEVLPSGIPYSILEGKSCPDLLYQESDSKFIKVKRRRRDEF